MRRKKPPVIPPQVLPSVEQTAFAGLLQVGDVMVAMDDTRVKTAEHVRCIDALKRALSVSLRAQASQLLCAGDVAVIEVMYVLTSL
jgi:hypothetical protein